MGVTLEIFDPESEGQPYAAGQTIFSEGDRGNVMYVVLEGEVELRFGSGAFDILGPGEPFGELALIDDGPRMATAMARTSCRLVAISGDRFLHLIQDTPYFALQIMKVMADRLRKAAPVMSIVE